MKFVQQQERWIATYVGVKLQSISNYILEFFLEFFSRVCRKALSEDGGSSKFHKNILVTHFYNAHYIA